MRQNQNEIGSINEVVNFVVVAVSFAMTAVVVVVVVVVSTTSSFYQSAISSLTYYHAANISMVGVLRYLWI